MTYIPDTRTDETYNQKYLNEKDREFIRGFDFAVDDVLESFFMNVGDCDLDVEGEDIDLAKIFTNHPEITEKLKTTMQEWIEGERDTMITSMIDHMEDTEYDAIKEKVDSEEADEDDDKEE